MSAPTQTGDPRGDPDAHRRPADPHLALPAEERLRVNEIFYSIQGESTRAGWPCVLVRLTGCQMRCSWCDSEYSFYEGDWMSRAEVVAAVAAFECPMVELTGGEPLLQPAVLPLMAELADTGYEVLLETGGGVDVSAVDPRVRRIVDVKCPGSGEAEANHWPNLELLTPRDEVKFVLADEADYRFAKEVMAEHGLAERCPVHLSPVHGRLDPTRLAEWVLRDRVRARVQIQIHKYLWDPKARGV